MDEPDWRICKAATLLKACASDCESIYAGSGNGLNLCRIKNAVLMVSLFWSALALMILLLGCIYLLTKSAMSRYDPNNVSNNMASTLASARHSWHQAIKWKPWGLKLSALIGLGVFWFDKATDVKVLLGLAVDGTPLRLLLALLHPICSARIYKLVSVDTCRAYKAHVEPLLVIKAWQRHSSAFIACRHFANNCA